MDEEKQLFQQLKECKIFPSKNCTKTTVIRQIIPVTGLIAKPTITTGIPPIYGPKYGIILVIAQKIANNNGEDIPAIKKPISDKIITNKTR